MRRRLKRTSGIGLRSRAFRCRLERLESRSMMAADVAAAMPVAAMPVDACQVYDLQESDPQPWAFVDPEPFVDPVTIDDSFLMVGGPAPMPFDFADIRVQFVASENEPGWAAYSYTVGVDGVVQGVSVVASYDEPTIAAFVAEHADDPAVQISDSGDGWWIGGFPVELAPPVPDAVFPCGYGFCGGGMSSDESSGDGIAMPLFSARGADMAESSGDAIAADVATSDVGVPADPQPGGIAVIEPVAVSPRSAAFADMSMMAAAATTAAADAPAHHVVIGGGRRRR